MNGEQNAPLSKKQEKRLERREQKERDREKQKQKTLFKKIGKIAAGIVVLVIIIAGIQWIRSSDQGMEDNKLLSRNGVHWHARLSIMVKGERQEIPSGIGLGVTHNPMHTHDADGEIHIEFSSAVREDNVRLKEFFKVWKKEFSGACIFEFCNGPEGAVKMLVNGNESAAFENYRMGDGDRVEIRYE